MGRKALIAIIALVVVASLVTYFVRPPGPGQVYSYRSDQYGIAGHTALLLRKGDCLVLSRSGEDIGKIAATAGAEDRLYVIAGTERIRSDRDEDGPFLRDLRNDLIARPGDAIDAEILFKPTSGAFGDMLAAGWPLNQHCGRGLAIVVSIARVHR